MFGRIALFSVALNSMTCLAEAPASYNSCIGCHGPGGQGSSDVGAPALSGQIESYLVRRISEFRDNADAVSAQAQLMATMASHLSDTDISEISVFLSRQEVNTPQAPSSSNDSGYKIYQGNCGACHGVSGQGNEHFSAPRLVDLEPDYIRRQIAFYQSEAASSERSSRYSKQMAMMARTIDSDSALDAIIRYIDSL